MRQGAGGRAGKSRRVPRGSRQAVRIFRRRGDESDGREGKSESDQRHPAREAGRLTGRGLLRNIYFVLHADGVVLPVANACTPLSQAYLPLVEAAKVAAVRSAIGPPGANCARPL